MTHPLFKLLGTFCEKLKGTGLLELRLGTQSTLDMTRVLHSLFLWGKSLDFRWPFHLSMERLSESLAWVQPPVALKLPFFGSILLLQSWELFLLYEDVDDAHR